MPDKFDALAQELDGIVYFNSVTGDLDLDTIKAAALLRAHVKPLVRALEASPEFVIDNRDGQSRCWSCGQEAHLSHWGGTTSKPVAIYRVNHSPDCLRQFALAIWKNE